MFIKELIDLHAQNKLAIKPVIFRIESGVSFLKTERKFYRDLLDENIANVVARALTFNLGTLDQRDYRLFDGEVAKLYRICANGAALRAPS